MMFQTLLNFLCRHPSPEPVYLKNFQFELRIHGCCTFVEIQGPNIYQWRLGSQSSLWTCCCKVSGPAIDAKDMDVLIEEKTATAWEQWRLFQIASVATLHTLLEKLGTISKAFIFFIPSFLAILLISSLFSLRGQCKTMQTGSVMSPCDIVFVPLLVGKFHFLSLRVLLPSSLKESKSRFWMSLL